MAGESKVRLLCIAYINLYFGGKSVKVRGQVMMS